MNISTSRLILTVVFIACFTVVYSESNKYRIIIMTDMTHDDGNSLIRYLYYSHLFETEAIIVTPQLPDYEYDSKEPWQKCQDILSAYKSEYEQLSKHQDGYPTYDSLKSVTKKGHGALPIIWLTNDKKFDKDIAGRHVVTSWGDIKFEDWIGEGNNPYGLPKDSEGSEYLQKVFEKDDDHPIYVEMWGGPIAFIQALYRYKKNHTATETLRLLSKLHIYGILLQDITFDFLIDIDEVKKLDCTNFGTTTSTYNGERLNAGWLLHDGGHFWQYCCYDGEGWVKPMHENDVKGYGPMSNLYDHGGEGDSPAFLYLLSANLGLNDPLNPTHGSWGSMFKPMGEPFPDGYYHTCDIDASQLMRWKEEVRNSFLNRLNYSIKAPTNINHEPQCIINGNTTNEIIYMRAEPGNTVTLNASQSFDPDSDELSFSWFRYDEADNYNGTLLIEDPNQDKIKLKIPSDLHDKEIHIILKASDNGKPPLCAYRRIILTSN